MQSKKYKSLEGEFQVEKKKKEKKIPDFICLDFILKLKISCTTFY